MRKSTLAVVGLALAAGMAGPVRAAGNEGGAPRFRLEILLARDVENTEPAGEALVGLDERDVAAYDGQARRMVLRPEVSLRLLAAVQKLPDLPERLYKLRALWLNGDLEDIVSHRGFRTSLDGRPLSGGILLSRFSSLSPGCPVIHAEMDGSRRIELRFAGEAIDSKVEALFADLGIPAEPPAVPVVKKPEKPPVLLAVNPYSRDAEEGWSLYFGYPDDVLEVRYRLADGPGSDWSVAGYGQAALGELGPGRHRIELEALDFAGERAGRYTLWLDPEHEAILGSRHILDMTANSWFSFSDREDWDETCFFYSHLLGHREALKEVRYSFDNCSLDRRIALSTELDKAFEWVPRTVSYACVKLVYRDGETTAPRRFYHHPEEIARLAKPLEPAAEAPADSSTAHPVSLSTSVSNSGWMLLFDFEPERSVRMIRYRFAGDPEWHSTGPDTSVNLLTGERLARIWMVIEAHKLTLGRQRIEVKLTDWNGVESGPYSVWFDPEREIVETAKGELRKPESEWAGFDDETEDQALLMFSGVVGSLDALREVRYSIDGCALDRRLPFRPWTYLGEDQGDYDDGFVWLPRTVRSACVQLVFRDGETTEPRQYFHKPKESALAAGAGDPGEALREAARAGDLARVEALLAAGAPVDAPARYGQTPLYFAAEKGHLAVARRLVERGANVNAQDGFFGSSALDMALQGGHGELARYLLAHGAENAAAALAVAIDSDDLELARAALATGLVEPLDLAAARREVQGRAGPLSELLAKATAKPRQRPPYKAAPERLSALAGRYRDQIGKDATVAVHGKDLGLTLPGETETVLTAVAEDRFDSADGGLSIVFGGRGGLVEWARVNRGGEVSFLGVVTSDPTPLRTAMAPGAEGKPEVMAAPRPWPQFRGPRASGIGDGQGAPAAWNVATGEGVRFKTPIPGIGLSSPIVWGDRIFVTTAVSAKGDATFRTGIYGDATSVDDHSEHSFRLYALDAVTGRVAWEREVHRGAPQVQRHLKSSLANATPATDGERVVVLFGAVGKLAAYDFDGKPLWQRDVGILDCNDPQSGSAEWGHASSPILYGDLVLVQGDRRKDSFLAAYRLATGEEVWRVAREEPSTWGTPNVLPAPTGDELIANGPTIRAYDPRTGRPLWSLGPSSEVVVATPVVGDGLAFVTAGYPPVRPVFAIRPGQRGDLSLPRGESSSKAVAWSHARGGTYIPSPILYRGILYTCNNNGILTAYRAETGEQLSMIRLSDTTTASFAASPIAADGRLYFASETGDIYILRAGPEPELLAVQPMGEIVMSTPAISGGLLVVRTLNHVFGLAQPAASAITPP